MEGIPRSPDQGAFHGRLENLNNVFRAFGVDAKATRSSMGLNVRSTLHPQLRHFVGVGVGGNAEVPCFHISPNKFLKATRHKKILHDGLLVEMLHHATAGVSNGIQTWSAERGSCVLQDVLRYYDKPGSSTLCLVLSPTGVVLVPSSSRERREPGDIFAC